MIIGICMIFQKIIKIDAGLSVRFGIAYPICPWHCLSLKPYQIGSVLTMGRSIRTVSGFIPATHRPMPRCVRSSPVPPGPVQSGLSLLRALVTGHVLYEQGVCEPHGGKRLPFSPRARGFTGGHGPSPKQGHGPSQQGHGPTNQSQK